MWYITFALPEPGDFEGNVMLVSLQTILFTIISGTIVGAVASAIQNAVQGDDVKKSAIGGLVGGFFTAGFGILTYMICRILKISPIG
ncbi:MAG TPA: hypothetical protein VKB86_09515 [Pyrinomonadaceae bacterium]|nr:hypothetical protein [Pyrinomonadaceae bacterium]